MVDRSGMEVRGAEQMGCQTWAQGERTGGKDQGDHRDRAGRHVARGSTGSRLPLDRGSERDVPRGIRDVHPQPDPAALEHLPNLEADPASAPQRRGHKERHPAHQLRPWRVGLGYA